MSNYSAWLLEYAHIPEQPISAILAGQHNKGTRDLTFTFGVIVGEGHKILIDAGINGDDEISKKLSIRDGLKDFQPPVKMLQKIGLKTEDIDTVIFTHAHFDHMENMDAFPNAHFYVQKKEIMGWIEAMTLEKKFSSLAFALNPNDIVHAIEKIQSGRMTLIDG
ncbi:MAG: MBL fold metallo-hydrolase, partial [Ruminiclostridium sp.]